MKNNFKISIISPNGPASWPSVAIIHPELISILKSISKQTEVFNILENKLPSLKDDLWIFPAGSVQIPVLMWLANCFKNPLNRPPAIFIFGGEATKLGYHLWHFRGLFRPEDLWVVACQAEKELLDYWFPGNNRTHVLYHPVSNHFKPAKDKSEVLRLRQKLKIPPNKKVMLYAGRLSQQKNILALLDLLELHKNLNLLVCGDIDSVGIPHLESSKRIHVANALLVEIGKRGLTKRIEFRAFQSQSELKNIMKACDYQVSLSAHYGEDFGYSIVQGLACGLKTIISNWGGHRNWKYLEEKNAVSFVELDWSNGQDVGVPDLATLNNLPKKSPLNFHKNYNKEIKEQLKKIVEFALFQREYSGILALPELVDFWEESARSSKGFLFSSSENKLFQKVVKGYQGQN
ncbi:MAG: glycosyltransferase [Bacteriovorax sp.]|nr:glycosyltransferase [Bacteriovorax sp.]